MFWLSLHYKDECCNSFAHAAHYRIIHILTHNKLHDYPFPHSQIFLTTIKSRNSNHMHIFFSQTCLRSVYLIEVKSFHAIHFKFITILYYLLQSNYKCPVCQKMFIRKDFYLQHECRGLDGQIIRRSDNMALLHNMENEQGVICFKCGKTFSSQSALTKHLKVRVMLILHLYANACQFSKTL